MKGSATNALLNSPMDGSISVIHESVVASPGIMNETQNTTSSVLLIGMLVRARTQAMTVAMGKLMAMTRNQIITVFRSAWKMRGSSQATRQLSSPHVRSPNQMDSDVLKLIPRIRMIGKIRKNPSTRSRAAMTYVLLRGRTRPADAIRLSTVRAGTLIMVVALLPAL